MNQAFFLRLYIDDEDGVRADLAEPFKTLFGSQVMLVAGRGSHDDSNAQDVADRAGSDKW